LLDEQQVRSEDILVLGPSGARVQQLAQAAKGAGLPGIVGVHLALQEKDELLGQRGRLSFSTVASAKGYDAYCVLLASVNEFHPDIRGRATFYVGCTRAIEHLEVFAYAKNGLTGELERVLHVIGADTGGGFKS
jgi:hypothetical protein